MGEGILSSENFLGRGPSLEERDWVEIDCGRLEGDASGIRGLPRLRSLLSWGEGERETFLLALPSRSSMLPKGLESSRRGISLCELEKEESGEFSIESSRSNSRLEILMVWALKEVVKGKPVFFEGA